MGLTATAAAVVPPLGLATGARAATAAGTEPVGAVGEGSAAAAESLVFDPSAYTELTTSITDTEGTAHTVRYHFYKVASYVAAPVDVVYQGLNVSVPVAVDGTAVDATHAPILFANSVGGYMPSSVASATGIGAGPGGGGPGGPGGPGGGGSTGPSRTLLALLAGYVVVEPGARGRTLVDSSGVYYGVAPAAIVDLKAAVRYVKANRGRIPGNVDRIVSSGTSAGGALSALLGASGDSPLYASLLRELGAADASDAVFASADWCPITDLEHADMAYEWCWGDNALADGSAVDATVSAELRAQFTDYLAQLRLTAPGFGRLTARNLDDHLVRTYLEPSAARYLAALSDTDRAAYLAANPFLGWDGKKATFTWADFLTHVGARKKDAPSFDAFDLSTPECNEFGSPTTAVRHFTEYSLRKQEGAGARLDADIPEKLHLMNPMFHLVDQVNSGRSRHWWIRLGTKDSDTSLTVAANLAARLENLGDDVDLQYYWDAGHAVDNDPGDFIQWIGRISAKRR
ncbi:subtype B tannase [Streptomyces sp. NPDC087294]|uniref:subtype B tannase n=1 Tax=Streptomyces sp. NPDC087294 TaxID=3365777 RepID=UPI00382900C4